MTVKLSRLRPHSSADANRRNSTCTMHRDSGLGFNSEAQKPRVDDDHGPALDAHMYPHPTGL